MSYIRPHVTRPTPAAWVGVPSALLFLCLAGWTGVDPHVLAQPAPPSFEDGPIHEIGQIPFQTAWQGREVKFRVRASELGPGVQVSAGYVQPPSGGILFENGNFAYRAGTNDKAEFTVTFSAAAGARRLEQIVPIQPIPHLPPEGEVLGVETKGMPDPTSRDYLVITDVKDAAPSMLNYARNNLRRVTISGKEVVIREGHANRLFESYHNNRDIREFTVHAEKLVVGSAFRLPSTRIVLRARRLEFQEHDGETGSISTQPFRNPVTTARSATQVGANATAGAAGTNGIPGGDIEVYVESSRLNPSGTSPFPRFILTGGVGQDGGPGRPGTNGYSPVRLRTNELGSLSSANKSRTTALVTESERYIYSGTGAGAWLPQWAPSVYFGAWSFAKSWGWTGSATVRISNRDEARAFLRSSAGSGWKPRNGGPGIPDGRPGRGGSAGRLLISGPLTNASLSWFRLTGGAPGTATSQPGGPPGTPSTAHAYFRDPSGSFTLWETHTAQAGPASVVPTNSTGPSTTRRIDATPYAWFTVPALRQVLNHAKDAYLHGELDAVHRTITDYRSVLDGLRATSAWQTLSADDQRDLHLIEEEMGLLHHRLAAGLDYFGNPPGWVPLLSLEANALAFSQEIDRAIGILYLEYWLSDASRSLESKLGAITHARVQFAQEAERASDDHETATRLLPQLDARALAIQQEIDSVQAQLKATEEELLKRAESNLRGPWWRRIARGLAAVVKLIPLPQTQLAGAALDVVSDFNPNAPWESLQGVQDVVKRYQAGEFGKSAQTLNATYKKIRILELPSSPDPGRIKGFIDEIQKESGPVVERLKEVRSAIEGTAAPRSQIEAELAKLKAESREFQGLADRISRLMVEKEAFLQQLSRTLQLLGNLSGDLTVNLLAMDAMNADFARVAGALDDRATMYLKEMGRRARERLLLYHYYVRKAYEYRLLKTYTGPSDLQNYFDRFLRLAEGYARENGASNSQLSDAQFKTLRGLYDDALGELIKEVVVRYNSNGPELPGQRWVALTEDDLDRLNRGETVSLDLPTLGGNGLFPTDEESIRIMDVRVLRLGAEPVGGVNVTDLVELRIVHAGESALRTSAEGRPRLYRFSHYTRDTDIPVQWGARLFPATGDLRQVQRSRSADSLLGALLQREGYAPRQVDLFTYLGGLARLDLSISPGARFRVNEVLIEIEYEFVRRNPSLRSLDVIIRDGLAPYVELSAPDLGGRQDGLGSFSRTYLAGAALTLSVPDRMGNLRFAGFANLEDARPLSLQGPGSAPVLHRDLQPSRTKLPSHFDGTSHRLPVTLASDLRIEARYEAIDAVELRIRRNGESPGLELELDGERQTAYRLETAPFANGPWLPLRKGVLMGPEQHLVPSPNAASQFYRITPDW